MRNGNLAVKARLQHDLKEIELLQESTGELSSLNLICIEHPQIIWKMKLKGGAGTYWHGQEYDFEIHFGRQFPFEPPKLHFPSTPVNSRSIRHPAVGRNGNLDMESVSKDNWNCSWSMLQIIREVQSLFCTNPEGDLDSVVPPLLLLPEDPLFTIIGHLPLRDIMSLSSTCKKALIVLHSNALWAKLYFTRCRVPAAILYHTGTAAMHAGPGPLREFSEISHTFEWRHAREAFVRTHECSKVIERYQIPNLEVLAASELSFLLPMAHPADFTAARQAAAAQQQHSTSTTTNNNNNNPTASTTAAAAVNAANTTVNPVPTLAPPAPAQQLPVSTTSTAFPPGSEPHVLAALRYRCRRAARLAAWLGGEACINHNIMRNYWSNIPVTTLINLGSLSMDMGQQGTPRVAFCNRIQVEGLAHTVLAKRRIQELERKLRELQFESGMLLHSQQQSQQALDRMDDRDFDTPYSIAPSLTSSSVETDTRKMGGLLTDTPTALDNAAEDLHDEVQLKLRLVRDLLRDSAAGRPLSPPENCDNFRHPRDGSRVVEVLHGPDVYDIVEFLHESNIAISHSFRSMTNSTGSSACVDCLDQNGDWVAALVQHKSRIRPIFNLFALENCRPSERQLQLRVEYLLSEIKIVDQHHLLAAAALQRIGPSDDGASSLHRLGSSVLKATVLRRYQHENQHKWICINCTTLNFADHGVCFICKSQNYVPLPVTPVMPCSTAVQDAIFAYISQRDNPQNPVEYDSSSRWSTQGTETASTVSSIAFGTHQLVSEDLQWINEDTIHMVQEMDIEQLAACVLRHQHRMYGIDARAAGPIEELLIQVQLFLVDLPSNLRNQPVAVRRTAVRDFHRLCGECVARLRHLHRAHIPGRSMLASMFLEGNRSSGSTSGGAPRDLENPDPAGPTEPLLPEDELRSTIYNHLAACSSPFLSFSAHQAMLWFRHFCATLEEEQKEEFALAATYRAVREVVSSQKTPLTLPAVDEHSDLRTVEQQLDRKLGSLSLSNSDALTTSQLTDYSVPVLSLWPLNRPHLGSSLSTAYRQDVLNNLIRLGGACDISTSSCLDELLTLRNYDSFNFTRRLYDYSTVIVHFCGYANHFDERLTMLSARLAPYRTHTTRPITVGLNAVGELLMRAQDEASGVQCVVRHSQHTANVLHPFDCPGRGSHSVGTVSAQRRRFEVMRPSTVQRVAAAPEVHPNPGIALVSLLFPLTVPTQLTTAQTDTSSATPDCSASSISPPPKRQKLSVMYINMRCLWLISRPGGGIVWYKVPSATPLSALLVDFCGLQGILPGMVRACQLDMIQCARYAYTRRTPSSLQSDNEAMMPTGTATAEGRDGDQPGILYYNQACSLEELGVSNNCTIDLIYKPRQGECMTVAI